MSKTQKIILAVAALVIVAMLVIAGVTGGAMSEVACIDCHGEGLVDGVVCENCGETCPNCEGEKIICKTCGSSSPDECEDCKYERNKTICETCAGIGRVQSETGKVRGNFWALVPPVIAIGLALITKEVYSSLFIGIVSGALLYTNFNPITTIDAALTEALIPAVSDTAGIFIFLVELGILVAMINKAGGSAAFGKWAQTHIKTRVGAMLATFVLGVLIFIDDYFNCLTVGSVMRPVTDAHKISRAKLAYLIDATAAPICMIAPISSWAAAVSQYAEDGKGLDLFISAIPFNFYSLLTFVFIIGLAVMGFDYGSMRIHEFNAKNKGDLYTSGDRAESQPVTPSANGKIIDLIFPIAVLIVVCVFALVYNGGILDGENFITAFSNTDATVALPWGGMITLVISMIYYAFRKSMTLKEMMDAVPSGFIAMVPAILILTFATALKNITSLMGAKYFVADLMNSAAAGLNLFLPAIIFLVACVLAFATGTSWGTFGILIPIVTYMFNAGDPILIISMSACLAGAVCGDHCSPISDTTIMSSAGAECNHINHVSTQMPYAITVAGISFVMFILAGFIQNAWICLPIGVALTIGTLFVIKAIVNKKETAK